MAWVGFPADGFAWTGPVGEPQWYATFPTTKRGLPSHLRFHDPALDDGSDDIGITGIRQRGFELVYLSFD
ncbi:hypothetical protein [Nocardia sp. NPDC023988]|uniref:hypothetical protein n=1 Tax=unclassified Nocardia TaxID=2637762 RepID=UPI0034083710